MIRIDWSPQSIRDIEAIRTYVAKDSERYAELLVARIVRSVERLAMFPESGRIVPERNDPSIREVISKPHRIVYRVRPEIVEIVTVFRASRIFPEPLS